MIQAFKQFPAGLFFLLAIFLSTGTAGIAEPDPAEETRADTVTRAALFSEPARGPRILAMGDSAMVWNSGGAHASIPEVIAAELGEPVVNRAVSGAYIVYRLPLTGAAGMRIRNQYVKGDWDWVVLDGGGNDLWLGCGCSRCQRRMNKMISSDGTQGDIPKMVANIRRTGARVLYLGYLRSPGVGSIIEHCRDDGDELERRLGLMAARMDGVSFLSVADLVPYGDRSYHAFDMIHPSIKGSRAIGRLAAQVIRDGGG